MRLLVTGSSGHLGEALVRSLSGDGHEVVGIDPLPGPTTSLVGSTADRDLVRAALAPGRRPEPRTRAGAEYDRGRAGCGGRAAPVAPGGHAVAVVGQSDIVGGASQQAAGVAAAASVEPIDTLDLAAALAAREAEVSALSDQLSAAVSRLETAALERDVALASAEANAEAAKAVTAATARQVDELRGALSAARAALAEARVAEWQARAEAAEARLAEIEGSKAWQFVTEYRSLRSSVKRLR